MADAMNSSNQNDSAYTSCNQVNQHCSLEDGHLEINDSGYTNRDVIFEDGDVIFQDETTPTQEEFNQEVKQGVLTSTDPSESLEQRINKINTPSKSLSITL